MTHQETPDADEPLEVVAVSGPAEAQMIEETLRTNGIDCSLQGNVDSNPWPATGDLDEVRILVRHSDAERANELLAAFYTPVGKDELVEGDASLGVNDPDEPGGFKI
jgi:hypothetical protein